MRIIASKDAKTRFGHVLDEARSEPVAISRNGREVVVMMSVEEYRRFEALENAYWLARAEAAEREAEWSGATDSERFLKTILNAED